MSKANFFVDLQNKGKRGKYEPFVVMYPGLNPASLQPKLLAFAKSFGCRFISDAGSGGSISPKFAGRPQVVAGSKGIIAIMSQCGGDYRIEEGDIAHQVKGVRNLMKHLAMVEGEPETTKDQLMSTQTIDVRSNAGGFLSLSVKLGDGVKKRQMIGEITDLFYRPLEKIEAPTDGYVTMITTTPTISSGDVACNIGVARPLS
jgi:predicted deacylase